VRPLFTGTTAANRLDHTDAVMVDTIATDAGFLDILDDIGDVSFYPNGGIWRQPECSDYDIIRECLCGCTLGIYRYSEWTRR
jgi:hypothetical protein